MRVPRRWRHTRCRLSVSAPPAPWVAAPTRSARPRRWGTTRVSPRASPAAAPAATRRAAPLAFRMRDERRPACSAPLASPRRLPGVALPRVPRVPARTAAPGYRDSSGMVLSCHGRQNTPGAWRARGIKCVSRVLAVDVGTSPRGPALGSFHRVLRGSTMSPLTTLSGIGDLCWSSRKRSHRRVSCRCSRSSSLGASRVASLRCRKPRAAHARHRDIKCTRRHRQPAARAPKEMSSSSKSRALG